MALSWFKLTLPLLVLAGVVVVVLQRMELDASTVEPGPGFPDQASTGNYVIIISVDGLRSDAIQALGAGQLPVFRRIRDQGATTDNARSIYSRTQTVPSHVSMVTARSVFGPSGHQYDNNGSPSPTQTLHQPNDIYIASIFEVAHDYGLRTAFHSSKTKLAIIDQSYRDNSGAEDLVGIDHGKDKLDVYTVTGTTGDSAATVDALLESLADNPPQLSFVHLVDLDITGHRDSWMSPEYLADLQNIDGSIGRVLDAIENHPLLHNNTTVIVTADHGGKNQAHLDEEDELNYTIPFYTWGRKVTPASDLYALNPGTRSDPGSGRPDYSDPEVPIRNADSANLALSLLGLPPVPSSNINSAQDLATESPNVASDFSMRVCLLPGRSRLLTWTPVPGSVYTVEVTSNLLGEPWTPLAPSDQWPTTRTPIIDESPALAPGRQFYRVRRAPAP